MIYGTAHQYSLATRLKEWGAPEPRTHAVHPLHESEYLPADIAAYNEQFRRVIALKAFRSIGLLGGQDDETWDAARNQLYQPLERLNESSEDHIRILCELIGILKTSDTNSQLATLRINNMFGRIVEGNL